MIKVTDLQHGNFVYVINNEGHIEMAKVISTTKKGFVKVKIGKVVQIVTEDDLMPVFLSTALLEDNGYRFERDYDEGTISFVQRIYSDKSENTPHRFTITVNPEYKSFEELSSTEPGFDNWQETQNEWEDLRLLQDCLDFYVDIEASNIGDIIDTESTLDSIRYVHELQNFVNDFIKEHKFNKKLFKFKAEKPIINIINTEE